MELSNLKKKQKKNFPSDQNKKSHTVSMYNSKKRTYKNGNPLKKIDKWFNMIRQKTRSTKTLDDGNPPNQRAEIKITQL